MSSSGRSRFFEQLHGSFASGTFVKLTLSRPADRAASLRNVYARFVDLKEGRRVSLVWHYATRDETQNLPEAAAIARLDELLGAELNEAHLFTTTGDWRYLRDRLGKEIVSAARPAFSVAPTPAHDRRKPQSVAKSAGFLRALGVTNERGEARPAMADKLRQIERFTELLGHLIADSPLAAQTEVRIADMGAGKGYLTFATYEFFRARGVTPRITGVEQRAELVDAGNRIAREVGFENLHFVQGAIGDAAPADLDVLIALHACDTATDDALHHGVRAHAALLLTAPCCHQELRPQLAPPPLLSEVLKHGILLQREAEILTDGLRALLLEMHGYKASVFEFIAPEHTGKNLMIAAHRRAHALDAEPLRARFRELATAYGIREQRLARLLGEL